MVFDEAELSLIMMTFATPRLLPTANNALLADSPAASPAVPPATPFFLGVSVSLIIFLPRPMVCKVTTYFPNSNAFFHIYFFNGPKR